MLNRGLSFLNLEGIFKQKMYSTIEARQKGEKPVRKNNALHEGQNRILR